MSQVPLTISIEQKEPSGARLIATLALAGMLSGLSIAGAYQVTKPAIERNNARALERAVYNVVPGSTQMRKLVLRDGQLQPLEPGEEAGLTFVIAAYDDAGAFAGFAIPGDGPGFQDTIRLIYGYDPVNNCIVGMEVLESRETPGLGDKIIKDDDFLENFRALSVSPEVVLVKEDRESENEVDAITGATISSRAVVNIINQANVRWLELLPSVETLPAPAPVEPAIDPAAEEGTG